MKRQKMFSKTFASILSVLVLVNLMITGVFALDSTTTTKTGAWIDEDVKERAIVTFEIPTDDVMEVTPVFDVVIVYDRSNSANITAYRATGQAMIDALAAKEGVEINVGVVSFDLTANNRLSGLVPLYGDDKTTNTTTARNAFVTGAGVASNIYAGLQSAKGILDASSTPKENQYVLLISDLGGFVYADAAGNPVSKLYLGDENSFTDTTKASTAANQEFVEKMVSLGTTGYTDFTGYADVVAALKANPVEIFEAFVKEGVLVETHATDKEVKVALEELSDIGTQYGEYQVKRKNIFSSTLVANDLTEVDIPALPRYWRDWRAGTVSSYEKSAYLVAHQLLDFYEEGRNTVALTSVYHPEYTTYKEAYTVFSNAFGDWLEGNITARYDYSQGAIGATEIDEIFAGIEATEGYEVQSGVLYDTIHPDFTLDVTSFFLQYGDTATTPNETVDPLATSGTLTFGVAVDGQYPFTLDYDISDPENQTIELTVASIPNRDNPIVLSFEIELNNPPTTAGDHLLDTNKEARFDYIDAAGDEQSIAYVSPQLNYTVVEQVVISGEKWWNHRVNPEENHPEYIIVNVLDGETVVASETVTDESNWTWEFELPKYREDGVTEIEYTMGEEPVVGYKTTIDGYDIINDFETVLIRFTKTWVHKNNPVENRPTEVTIYALDGDTIVAEEVISEYYEWSGQFELPKYREDGKTEIIYTLNEQPVEHYETVIDGYNITNTYIQPISEEEIPITPPTGVNSNSGMWFALIVVSSFILFEATRTKKLERM